MGFLESVTAIVNMLIDFDPLITDHKAIRKWVESLLRKPPVSVDAGRLREVEVCYGGELSPDLDAVAKFSGLSVDEAISCHLQGDYQVRMYGFAPG